MKLKKVIPALKKGFTLIELLVVMGIIAILVATVAFFVDPAKQFARANDTTRRADLTNIVTAVYQYAVDNKGNIPTQITTTPTNLGTGAGLIDLSAALAPYLPSIPKDPTGGTDADTKYILFKEGSPARLVASASAEATSGYITIKR